MTSIESIKNAILNTVSVAPRLNLAVVIPQLAKYGGAERYVLECVREWQGRHEITIYAASIDEALLREHHIADHVKRTKLTSYFDGQHSLLLNAVLLPKIWREEIGRHDIYHTHLWPTHLIDLHPMVWFPHEPLRVLHDLRYEQNFAISNQEVVRNVHVYPKYSYDQIGDSVFDAYLSVIDDMDKAAKPDRIVANSLYTAKYLESIYESPVNDVVYPGVESITAGTVSVEPNLFITISQLWTHKRVSLLIEAIALTDDAQLVIVGSGPEKERLVGLAVKLGIEHRVSFQSGLNNHDLRLLLARACAFLFSPINEPFGIVVLEAMAAGKPIVAVKQGGYMEVCQSDYAFLLPAFPIAFAEKIANLQRNPEMVNRMGQAASAAALRYTWKRTASELESILIDSWHQSASPTSNNEPTGNKETLVGIQYYLWYGDGYGEPHWNDNLQFGYVEDKPMLGYYASARGQTINHHLDQFEDMGLDYVVLNLHMDDSGVNPIEWTAIQHVFAIARKRHSRLRFSIQLAPYLDDEERIAETIKLIEISFASHPNHLRLEGRPVMFWFWSSVHDGNRRLLNVLTNIAANFTNLAVSLRLPSETDESKLTFGFFQGFSPFSPLELADEKNWYKVWDSAYLAAHKAKMRYRTVTVSPGYDDRALDHEMRDGNVYRLVQRKDGATYQRGLDWIEGLSQRPHLVTISTFNEYHENTHIQPSLNNGATYLDLTRSFVDRVKNKLLLGLSN